MIYEREKRRASVGNLGSSKVSWKHLMNDGVQNITFHRINIKHFVGLYV